MDENSAVSSSAGPAQPKPAAAQLDLADPTTASAARRLLLGLFSGSSVVVLDFFIVLVCLPSISQSLHASSAHLQLVVAIYAVGSGSFLILGGRLGDVFGRRRVFSVGVVIFALASLACGLATSIYGLLIFRFVQGLGGAMLQPQVLGLLSINFVPSSRSRAFGLYAASLGVTGIVAQLIGGAFVEALPQSFGWRACFLLSLPLCAIASYFSRKATEGPRSPGRVDVIGGMLLAVCFGLLTVGLVFGRESVWSSASWGALAGAGVAASLFIGWAVVGARGAGERIIPTAIWRRGDVWRALSAVFVFYAGLASFYFVLVLQLKLSIGISSLQSGLIFGWLGMCFVAASSSKHLKQYLGKGVLTTGIVVLALGHVAFAIAATRAELSSQLIGLVASCALEGAGLGLLMGQVLANVVTLFRQEEVSLGGGLASATHQLGNSIGVVAIGFAYFEGSGNVRRVEYAVAYLVLLLAVLFVIESLRRRRADTEVLA